MMLLYECDPRADSRCFDGYPHWHSQEKHSATEVKDCSVAPYSAQYLITFFPRNLTPGCWYWPMHFMSATTPNWSCDSCGPSMLLISPIFPYHVCSWAGYKSFFQTPTTSAITHELSLSALNTDKDIQHLTVQLGSIYHLLWRIPSEINEITWLVNGSLLLHRRSIWNTPDNNRTDCEDPHGYQWDVRGFNLSVLGRHSLLYCIVCYHASQRTFISPPPDLNFCSSPTILTALSTFSIKSAIVVSDDNDTEVEIIHVSPRDSVPPNHSQSSV